MELGEDFASLAIALGKRKVEPESLSAETIKDLAKQVNRLQEQVQSLMAENYELKKLLMGSNINIEDKTVNVNLCDYLRDSAFPSVFTKVETKVEEEIENI